MKIGLISDIHANLPALRNVINFLKKKDVSSIICCGDIVGYGPYPNEVIEFLKGIESFYSVCGNHDWAVLGLVDLNVLNEDAKKAILWTRDVLNEEGFEYLSNLPTKLTGPNFIIVHGSLRDPIMEYITGPDVYVYSLVKQTKRILFVGHTHRPIYYIATSTGLITPSFFIPERPVSVETESDLRYLFNVGSVGQPRDGDPSSSCVIYDTKKREITLYRVPYDIEEVQKRMREVELPEFLIERLQEGI